MGEGRKPELVVLEEVSSAAREDVVLSLSWLRYALLRATSLVSSSSYRTERLRSRSCWSESRRLIEEGGDIG